MARERKVFKTSFAGGQVDEEVRHFTGSQLGSTACKVLKNAWIKKAGAARTKPRTDFAADLSNEFVVHRVRLEGGLTRYICLRWTGSLAQAVILTEAFATEATVGFSGFTSAADLDSVQVAAFGSEVYFFLGNLATPQRPHVLTRSSAGTWSFTQGAAHTAFYDTGTDGSALLPYYKFPDTRGISITPSDYTGSITLTASDDLFVATDPTVLGRLVFRLLGREVTITAFNSATSADATVNQQLLPVYDVTVASTTGYEVGGLVEGSVTGYQGEVVSITSSTVVKVQMLDTLDNFDTSTPDVLIGAKHASTIASSALDTSPAAILDWEEPLFSRVRGWPSCGGFHRNRLHMSGNHAGLVAISALNAPRNFDVGTGQDEDAIIEAIGDGGSARVRRFVSHDDLILLTDDGPYYVPESSSGDQIYGPSTVFFKKIAGEPCSTVPPLYLKEGIVYANAGAPRLHIIQPNGNEYARWSVSHFAELATELVTDPLRLCLIDGVGSQTERALLVINSDGTAVALFLVETLEGPIIGASSWQPGSTLFWRSAASYQSQTVIAIRCPDGSGGFRWRLCELAFDGGPADAVRDYSSARTDYEDETVDLYQNGLVSIAGGTINSDGKFEKAAVVTEPASGLEIGYTAEFALTPVPPIDPETGAQASGIARVAVKAIQSQRFTINAGKTFGSTTAATGWHDTPVSDTGLFEPTDVAITSDDNSIVQIAAMAFVLKDH